ncbi:MAG: HD domain-containing phosphohydrolase [Terriglobia bacterium]
MSSRTTPAPPVPAAGPWAPADPAALPPRSSATILVVDDNQAVCALMAQMLHVNGYNIITAANGHEAVAAFDRHRPDLLLLDIMLPDLDGFQVCRHVKKNPETRLTPVILITGLSDRQDRLRGIEAGADDFLSKPVDRTELFARVRSLLSLKSYTDELDRAEAVLFALARSIEGKDPYTEGHCERLARYATRLGERIELSREQLLALRRGGIVHDIGKVAVPDSVLLKPGPLTPEEWKIITQHTIVGESICAPLKSFRLVLPIIRHHHEKCDGSGYPDGLRGEDIPLTARVLQLADVYDALTTTRPYKRALSPVDALQTMENEVQSGWWDARLFAEFRQLISQGNGKA